MDERTRFSHGKRTTFRIVVADDHDLVRHAIRELICRHEDLEVIAEAKSGKEVVEQCHLLRPDLVLMDIGMPEVDGLTATQQIKEELPSTAVLILTAFEEPDSLFYAMKAGADGYVLKHTSAEQLVHLIRKTLTGASPLDEALAKQLIMRLAEEQKEGGLAPRRRLPSEEHLQRKVLEELTDREVETLRLILKGQSNREIAQNLSISLSTAKQHVRHVLAKLGVSDRTQAALKGMELGLHVEHDSE